MSIENVKECFDQFGMKDRVMEFDVSGATVELAAEAVGVEGKRCLQKLGVNDKLC